MHCPFRRLATIRGLAVLLVMPLVVPLLLSATRGAETAVQLSASTSTGRWLPPTPIDLPAGDLTSVSCTSPSFCAAVDAGGSVVYYNGTSWSAPMGLDEMTGGLRSISCTSPTFCAAVDGNELTYDGTLWTLHRTEPASQPEPTMSSISCGSSSFCGEVGQTADSGWGYFGNPATPDGGYIDNNPASISCTAAGFCGLVFQDGEFFTENVGGPGLQYVATDLNGGSVNSVSCPTTGYCVAVDTQGNAVTYDGGFTLQSTHIDSFPLTAISCASEKFCVAVDKGGQALIDYGSSWSTPERFDSGGGGLTAVSCPTTTFCMAVDAYGDAFTYTNGSWSAPTVVDPGQGQPSWVSCPTSTFCAAVDGQGSVVMMNGVTWGAPTRIDFTAGLEYISCTSTTFCAAVDSDNDALTYNGTSWSSPQEIDTNNLFSLSCASASFCVAVGGNGDEVTYDGSSWASPVSIDPGNVLYGVSCPTQSFCVAGDTTGQALIYNGSAWSSPATTALGAINDLSCPSTTFCAAIDSQSMITYNGTVWSSATNISASPNLTGIACASAVMCTAVDIDGDAYAYNGSDWSGPAKIDSMARLDSVSCPTVSFCVALDPAGYEDTYGDGIEYPTATLVTTATPDTVTAQPVEVAVQVEGPVVAMNAPTPTGSVVVSDGKNTCKASLTGWDGVARGTCAIGVEQAGSGYLGASYSGDMNFSSSDTPSPYRIQVKAASSKTLLTVSPSRVSYGDEEAGHISVRVSPQYAGVTPTGTVKVMNAAVTLCTVSLKAGSGSCALSARKLAVGTLHLVANYVGSTSFHLSVSASEKLTVTKETSKTVLAVSTAAVTFGTESREHLSVKILPEFQNSLPTGTVRVSAGTTVLCTLSVRNGGASCTLSERKLPVGVFSLVANYGGSADFVSSTSAKEKLLIRG